jgi:hypothetical protein
MGKTKKAIPELFFDIFFAGKFFFICKQGIDHGRGMDGHC